MGEGSEPRDDELVQEVCHIYVDLFTKTKLLAHTQHEELEQGFREIKIFFTQLHPKDFEKPHITDTRTKAMLSNRSMNVKQTHLIKHEAVGWALVKRI